MLPLNNGPLDISSLASNYVNGVRKMVFTTPGPKDDDKKKDEPKGRSAPTSKEADEKSGKK